MSTSSAPSQSLSWAHGSLFILPIYAVTVVSTGEPFTAAAWLVVGGLASGFLSGLLGIGGALVTVPVLYVALPRCGVPAESLAHVVVASALAAMIPTALRAAWLNHRCGALDRRWLARLGCWMLVGAAAGALLATQLGGVALIVAFAAQSLYYGARLLACPDAAQRGPTLVGRCAARVPAWIAGPAIAAFCACVGMGGGSLVNPYLQSHGTELRTAIATTGALNLCIALGGSVAFCAAPGGFAAGAAAPAWGAAILLGMSAVVAVPLGVGLSHRLPVPRLALMVGGVNFVSAVVLLGRLL